MILPLNLNRRHKVTLFLTVVLAGIAALSGGKMMEVVGILLLGLALAWALGSDSRVVHWLFLSLGALLACGTVGLAWLIHQSDTNLYAKKVADFEQRIPELAKEYPLHKEGQIIWDKPGWRPVEEPSLKPEGVGGRLRPLRSSFPRTAGSPPETSVGNIRCLVGGCDVWCIPLCFGLGSNPRNPRQTASHLTDACRSIPRTASGAEVV
jgi:hypothetical protein